MDAPAYQDLAKVDRDVARANAALTAWRRDLAQAPDAHESTDPLAAARHVAGQSAYVAVRGDPSAGGGDALLREGLARWVAHLTLARIGRELDVDVARAEAAAEAPYALAPAPGRLVGFREAMRALPLAETRAEVDAWLDAAAARAGAVGAAVRERRARREEAAIRLGAEGTWALATRVPRAAVNGECERFLGATRTLAADVLKEARTKADAKGSRSPFDALAIGVARDAPEGWPSRLQPRWLLELFPRLGDGLRIELGALPAAAGASSFARALGAYGFALRIAGPSPSLPFALARDPSPTDAHRFAAVFATLASSPEFQRRALGNVARVAAAQARTMTRSFLFSARLAAARVLLDASADRFEELAVDVLGAPMPRGDVLGLAWPRFRDDEPSRILALFTSLPVTEELVQRFDDDWFRNPRAMVFLRARASAPAWDDATELDASAVDRLAKAFEGSVA